MHQAEVKKTCVFCSHCNCKFVTQEFNTEQNQIYERCKYRKELEQPLSDPYQFRPRPSRICRGCGEMSAYPANHVDGLCSRCHPYCFLEQYVGCVFCGCPIKYAWACHGCKVGFRAWLENVFSDDRANDIVTSAIYDVTHNLGTLKWESEVRNMNVPGYMSK